MSQNWKVHLCQVLSAFRQSDPSSPPHCGLLRISQAGLMDFHSIEKSDFSLNVISISKQTPNAFESSTTKTPCIWYMRQTMYVCSRPSDVSTISQWSEKSSICPYEQAASDQEVFGLVLVLELCEVFFIFVWLLISLCINICQFNQNFKCFFMWMSPQSIGDQKSP